MDATWRAFTAEGRARSKRWLKEFSSASRRVISTHRKTRKLRDAEISGQSRLGLDLTNFFMADVQMGFGSFLAFYLGEFGWSQQNVGFALTVGSLTMLLAQLPGGALSDAVHWKRGLTAIGVIAIAVSALLLALWPTLPSVFVAEVLHGLTGGIVATSIIAISLGLSGRHGIAARAGRNLRFAAAGNAVTAGIMGLMGAYIQSSVIFFAAAALCLPTLFGLWLIRPDEIDYVRARNAAKRDHSFTLHRVLDVVKNRQLLLFALCLVLFHFSNASLLPLVGQSLGATKTDGNLIVMAALIAGPQIVVALLAPWIGYWAELWGRKPLLLTGFACEALRAALFATVSTPSLMILCQLLDGITGATITLLTALVIADLTTGTGRFNLTQGVVGAAVGLAAASSTAIVGSIAHQLGDTISFALLASGTCLGLAILWLFFAESKPAKYLD